VEKGNGNATYDKPSVRKKLREKTGGPSTGIRLLQGKKHKVNRKPTPSGEKPQYNYGERLKKQQKRGTRRRRLIFSTLGKEIFEWGRRFPDWGTECRGRFKLKGDFWGSNW